MALSLVDVATSGGGNGTSITTTLPTGVTTNDIIYCAVYIASFDADRTVTVSGYTQLALVDGHLGNLYLFRKVAGASESAPNPTWTGAVDYRWIVWAVRGANTTTPEKDSGSVVDDAFDTTTPIPTLAAGGATVFSYVVHAAEAGDSWVDSWPAGWSNIKEDHAGTFLYYITLGQNTSPGTGSVGGGNITRGTSRAAGVIHVLVQEAAGLTREQEGYRWRADDGSETTATWLASQDTDISRTKDTVTRLRTLIDTTSDAPSEAVTLQYRKVGAGSWRDVPGGI
jgi:hypothetical protein